MKVKVYGYVEPIKLSTYIENRLETHIEHDLGKCLSSLLDSLASNNILPLSEVSRLVHGFEFPLVRIEEQKEEKNGI